MNATAGLSIQLLDMFSGLVMLSNKKGGKCVNTHRPVRGQSPDLDVSNPVSSPGKEDQSLPGQTHFQPTFSSKGQREPR